MTGVQSDLENSYMGSARNGCCFNGAIYAVIRLSCLWALRTRQTSEAPRLIRCPCSTPIHIPRLLEALATEIVASAKPHRLKMKHCLTQPLNHAFLVVQTRGNKNTKSPKQSSKPQDVRPLEKHLNRNPSLIPTQTMHIQSCWP